MYATHDTTTSSRHEPQPHPSSLIGKWADGRRRITPWAYPRLRALAALRFAIGVFLVVVGSLLVANGHPGWAAVPLLGAVLHFTIAYLDASAVRLQHHTTPAAR